ncbi:MAG: hypothetical protein CM1200mP14_14740 [Gammaproteobacteria bacterium]|nr:MAG: hypothetical protein CM1200mP14_14740 [Gammaproteobacteria bacterium]
MRLVPQVGRLWRLKLGPYRGWFWTAWVLNHLLELGWDGWIESDGFHSLNGEFVIRGLTGGRYQVSISHPSVEEVGFRPPPIVEEVVEGQVTAVQFRMPAKSDVVFEACRGESQEDGSAAVLGQVVDRRGRALPGATSPHLGAFFGKLWVGATAGGCARTPSDG